MGLHSLVEEYCSVNLDAKSSIWLKPRNFRVYQLLKLLLQRRRVYLYFNLRKECYAKLQQGSLERTS